MSHKERIPRDLKIHLWLKYATKNNELRTWTLCFCCKYVIKIPEEVRDYFDLYGIDTSRYIGNLRSTSYGHIIAETSGGQTNEENIRLICHECNTKMNTQNLYAYCKEKQYEIIEDYNDLMDVDPEVTSNVPEIMNVTGRDKYCPGINKTGESCGNKKSKVSDFCTVHTGNNILAK